MARLSLAIRLVAIGALACGYFAGSAPAEAEKLVPARFTPLMDKRANRWDVNPYGIVADGSNDCFDSGGMLQIGGSQVSFTRPMMTADGSEYVLTGRYRSLTVTRRVRLDAENGALRYLEIFTNPGSAPERLQATIHTGLGNSATQVLTVQDKLLLGGLGKDDGAFVAVQSGDRPGVVFVVADPKAKVKPQLRVSDNRNFEVTYALEVPPGGSTAFVHYLAQRINASATDARELLAAYYKRGRLIDPSIPKELHGIIGNFSLGRALDTDAEKLSPLLAPLQELADSAELHRGKLDGVLIDAGSKLTGTVMGGDFEIETAWGKTPVTFAEVAGVAGGAGARRPLRVFLRNGEILTGTAPGAKLAMTTESGLRLEVDLDEIHLLTLRAGETDGIAPPKAALLLTTQRGDRLALTEAGAAPLEAATPWGTVRVPLAELRSLAGVREPFPAHRLALADRSRFLVMLRGAEWMAPTLRFGPVKIVPQSIRELQRLLAGGASPETDDDPEKVTGPSCELLGESRLAGVIDLPALHLAAESSVTPVESKQIVQLEAEGAGSGDRTVTVKLAGGQELKGRLTEAFLPIRSRTHLWRVPVAHLVAFHAPEPEPQDAKPAEEKPAEEKKPDAPKPPGSLGPRP